MPPDFRFCPPRFFSYPPHGILLSWCFWAEKTLKFAISPQKKPSDFGEDLFFFFFFFFGDHLLLVGKYAISARKSLRISAKTFFFWRSPAFGWKICDFGQKKPSHFGENLCPLILILPPPPDLAKLVTPLR